MPLPSLPDTQVTPPQYQQSPTPPATQYFTMDDLEKARREERDKLYGRISKTDDKFKTLEEELARLRAESDQAAAQEKAQREAAEAELQLQREKEMDSRQLIEQRDREWNDRLAKIQQENEQARAMYEQDQRYMKLQNYIQRRANEETTNRTVAPDLIDFIDGNSEEEVENRIKMLREKTTSIINSLAEGQVQQRAAMPGVAPGGQPPMGGPLDALPTGNPGQQMTAEDIKKIPMSQWHEFRQRAGLANADGGGGMYS